MSNKHYNALGFNPRKYIKDMPFWLGNCVKYAVRHKYKGQRTDDLLKIGDYLSDSWRTDVSESAINALNALILDMSKRKGVDDEILLLGRLLDVARGGSTVDVLCLIVELDKW